MFPLMEAICSFLVWGGGNLQLVSRSLISTEKKKGGKKGKYYANSLQFGFKYSLYYDEPFPLVQTLPTCQDFFPLIQGRKKRLKGMLCSSDAKFFLSFLSFCLSLALL